MPRFHNGTPLVVAGDWDNLEGADQAARYGIIAGLMKHASAYPDVLDVGCGSGVLRSYLGRELGSYTGIDLSAEALAQAPTGGITDRYLCASFEGYACDRSYDVIIFNESLYYSRDPLPALRTIVESLRPGGLLIVSMFQKSKPWAWNNRCTRIVRAAMRGDGAAFIVDARLRTAHGYWKMWAATWTGVSCH